MNKIDIKYPTIIKQLRIGERLFVLETIRDLDEAIDLICDAMTEEDKLDPFAEDLCPYFGILWPGSVALASYLNDRSQLIKGRRVLELGCGLGLPSLLAAYLGGSVLATDFHPDVETYFKRNCRHSVIDCEFARLNWREDSNIGQYDLVMGSDILYESKHPREVALGLLRFVRPGGKIILSDPGRSYLQQFLNAMKEEGHKEELSIVTVDTKEIFLIEYTV